MEAVPTVRCVTFTGPTTLTGPQAEFVARHAAAVDAELYRSGGAPGVDSVAAVACAAAHPGRVHQVLYPYAVPWNADYLRRNLLTKADFVEAEAPKVKKLKRVESDPFLPRELWGESYMTRNDGLVAPPCELLVAFVLAGESYYRSGEWATINRARRRGVDVQLRSFH